MFIRERQCFAEYESWRYSENSYFICWSKRLQLWYMLYISISSAFTDQLDIIHRTEKRSWAEPGLFLDIVQRCFEKAEVLSSSSGLKRPGGALYILWAESSGVVHLDVSTKICPFQCYWNRFPYPLECIAIYVRNYVRKSGWATYALCLKSSIEVLIIFAIFILHVMFTGCIRHLLDKENIWQCENQKFTQLTMADQSLEA